MVTPVRLDPGPGGRGYSDSFKHTKARVIWVIFGVQNFEFQYFLGFSEKIIFFGV